MDKFDYTNDDAEEIAEEMFHDFRNCYDGLMSKELAMKIIKRFEKMVEEEEFSGTV